MPILTDVAHADLLSGFVVTQLSLHSAYSAFGANELTGGSPAYARVTASFGAVSHGVITATLVPYTFNVPAASTVAWIGMWDVSSNFLGMVPNGSDVPKLFVVTDPMDGTLYSPAHSFNTTEQVVGWKAVYLPDGMIWNVTAIDVDSLTLLDDDLNPPNIGAAFTGYLNRIIQIDYVSQSTFTINTFAIDVTLVG